MKEKKITAKLIWSGIFMLLFFGLIAALKLFDLQPIGPDGSIIGLASINAAARRIFGAHPFWYDITNILGIAAIAVAFGFAILGLCQLIHRKSLKKIDADLYILAAFYIVVAAVYVFFEVCVINYRPVLINSMLEPSFPSSHTMIALCIMCSAVYQLRRRIANNALKNAVSSLCILIMIITVVGRMICGVHWFTDIIGSILISASLVLLYIALDKLILDR